MDKSRKAKEDEVSELLNSLVDSINNSIENEESYDEA
jgi:hypothetical protein